MPDDEWNRGYSAGYSARDRETRAMLSELRLVADALGVDESDGGAVLRAVYELKRRLSIARERVEMMRATDDPYVDRCEEHE